MLRAFIFHNSSDAQCKVLPVDWLHLLHPEENDSKFRLYDPCLLIKYISPHIWHQGVGIAKNPIF